MTSNKEAAERAERRENERFRAKNGAFVALRPHYTKLGQISDISMGGLSFHYMSREELPNESFDVLDILVTNDDFFLEKVPFEIVADFELTKVPLSRVAIKRCSVRFGALTNDQRSLLENFIDNHTIH